MDAFSLEEAVSTLRSNTTLFDAPQCLCLCMKIMQIITCLHELPSMQLVLRSVAVVGNHRLFALPPSQSRGPSYIGAVQATEAEDTFIVATRLEKRKTP